MDKCFLEWVYRVLHMIWELFIQASSSIYTRNKAYTFKRNYYLFFKEVNGIIFFCLPPFNSLTLTKINKNKAILWGKKLSGKEQLLETFELEHSWSSHDALETRGCPGLKKHGWPSPWDLQSPVDSH